jgi:hypothetical protein
MTAICPLCLGKGSMPQDEGRVPCPSCALRAWACCPHEQYGGENEASRLRGIHSPEVVIGFIDPSGDPSDNWYDSIDPIDLAKADADWSAYDGLSPLEALHADGDR